MQYAKRRISFDERFARHGLKIFAKVPDSDFGGRRRNIQEYFDFLKSQGKIVTHFAILDDSVSDYAKAKLSDHLVKMSFYRGGLTKAIALFNQRHAFCDETIFNCPFRWTL